ncbi:hypothetical protein ACRAWD_01520 [Caulobacter segnis]
MSRPTSSKGVRSQICRTWPGASVDHGGRLRHSGRLRRARLQP